ncbi:hypothetical protein SAMN05444166_7716 [Singulisphaera sp. GP187]|uniref:hypothetical protein n=1 Tax=Singulisphaera sp. GP187 TaxID=1882752 RepID=UPI0009286A56|nr:hypothetical protein [Singulisphaera sp. GP187]SIO65513.1 hypothetical protein SAMN05444166_7716 [Singulisphaera sp. GP187]
MPKKKAAEQVATPVEGATAGERIDALFAFRATCKTLSSLAADQYKEGRAVLKADPETKAAIVREIASRLEPGGMRGKGDATSNASGKLLEDLLIETLYWSRTDEPPRRTT